MKRKLFTLFLTFIMTMAMSVTVFADDTVTINVSDQPQVGVISTLLVKKSSHQTTYPMTGAVFEIKHYPNTNGNASGNPIHTWRFQTTDLGNKTYGINGSNPSRVSGDALIPSGSIAHVWPLGTYTITEVTPPTGFLKSNKTYTVIVSYNASGGPNAANVTYYDGAQKISNLSDASTRIQEDNIWGNIAATKKDKDNAETSPQGNGSLAGIKFALVLRSQSEYCLKNNITRLVKQGEVIQVFTTDATGSFSMTGNNLRYGTYELIELRKDSTIASGDMYDSSQSKYGTSIYANSSYLYDTQHASKDVHVNGETVKYDFSNPVVRGGVHVTKKDLENTNVQGDATLAGIKFAIVNRSTNKVKVDGNNYNNGQVVKIITTDVNGEAKTSDTALPYGKYDVIELRADSTIAVGDVYNSSQSKYGTSIYANNAGASGVQDGAHGSMLFNSFTELVTIEHQKEMVGEGTRLSETGQPETFTDNRLHPKNRVVRGGFEAYKVDKETMISYPLEGASLAGIEFTLKNNSEQGVFITNAKYPNGHVYAKGEVIHNPEGKDVWTTDTYGRIGSSDQYLPYGNYTLQETKTNDSYHLTDGEVHQFYVRTEKQITGKDDDSIVRTKDEAAALKAKWVGGTYAKGNLVFPDQVKRGPLSFQKKNENGDLMKNIPWKITNTATGDVHYIMTDANGEFNSDKVAHSVNTNKYDDFFKSYDESGESIPASVTEEAANKYRYQVGMWFDLSKDLSTHAPVNDELGAFPYGWYTLEEMRCEANEGKELIVDEFYIYSDDGAMLGTLDNEPVDLKTQAKDALTRTDIGKVSPKDKLNDHVDYYGLQTDKHYRIYAELHYAKGEEDAKVDGGIISDKSGKEVKASKNLNPVTRDGYTSMDLSLDSTELYADGERLKGADTVIFVYLYEITDDGTEKLVKAHIDPNDKDETVRYPWMGTTLMDADTEIRMGLARKNMELVDRVEYHNLVEDEYYTFEGYLVDKSTGEPALDADGKEITTQKKVLIRDRDGFVNLTYKFNGEGMDGKTLVAFETMDSNFVTLVHHEINDEAQNFHIPKIRTVAKDKDTQDDVGKVVGTFVDTITYENLIPGYEYKMSGELMFQDSGKSSGQVGSKTFTATASASDANRADGSVVVEIPLNLSKEELEGKSLVAFEELIINPNQNDTIVTEDWLKDKPTKEKVLAEHKDIKDASQTVNYPKIRTLAVDSRTEDHVGTVESGAKVVDTIEYWNLVPGREYTIRGILVDTETGETLATASDLVFTAQEADKVTGKKQITFDIDSSKLAGHTVVVYEKLLHNDVEVTQHEENTDETQRVHYPWLSTTAIDSATKDHVGTILGKLMNGFRRLTGENVADTEYQKVIDKVEYKNTIASESYTIAGTLMNKETGNPILGDDGKPVTATAELKAGHPVDGSIELTFSVDSSKLENVTIVCYEKMLHKNPNTKEDVEVNRHENIKDEDQSVHNVEIRTTAVDESTADHVGNTRQNTVITDTVDMKNLVNGMEYKLVGTLYNKDTGEKILDANGNPYVKDETFTATGEGDEKRVNLTKKLAFNVDGTRLEGVTVVVFEDLYHNDVRISTHSDIGDEAQSVHFPKVTTNAQDCDTEDHVGTVKSEAQVKDSVTLENLIPGQKYIVRGTLMKFGTTQPVLVDGNKVTATKEITADSAKMTIELEFDKYDSNILRGETTVCFEYLYHPNTETGAEVEVAAHEVPDEEAQSVHYPKIRTIATDSKTGDHVGSIFGKLINGFRRMVGQDVADTELAGVVDTVQYENLIPDEEYTVEGTLMNKDTNKPITDEDGNVVTASAVIKAGHPANGTVDVHFSVDTSRLENVTIVCFEKLMHKNSKTDTPVEVDRHENIEDEEQSVHEVEMHTTAVDEHVALEGHGDKHIGDATGKTVINDAVEMKNLVKGMEYTLVGTLHYKEDGKEVLDAAGAPYKTTVKFTAEGEGTRVDQTVNVKFEVDGKALEGRTVVAFEELYHNDVMITTHADVNDEAQSVYYPSIRTNAKDNKNGAKETQVNEATEIIDEVTFKNLLPGKYKLSGVLMDKETGSEVLDAEGKAVTQEIEFVIATKEEGAEGSKDLVFKFDSSKMKSHIVVAYETLTLLDENDTEYNVPVAEHKDINDEKQSEWIIDIETHLTDVMDNSDEGEARKDAEWNDHVSYWGLIPGKEYIMKGVLMDKETNEPFKDASGNVVTAEAKFTPETKDGSVDITFKADTTGLAGHSVVAFEELYPSDMPETVIAEHKDINDEAQTVNIIEIRTHATDASTNINEGMAKTESTIVDRVTYTNLVVGREYILKAKMMDKKSGQPVLVNGQEVTQIVKFTPQDENAAANTATDQAATDQTATDAEKPKAAKTVNGYVDVTFVVDTSALAGETMVAYEQLFNAEFEDVVIAHHEDINDEEQSIHIPSVFTVAELRDKTVIDEVTYKNLVPGKYIARGWLVNTEDGKKLKESDGEAEFTLTEFAEEGSVEVELPVNGYDKLGGYSLTAFEEIYLVTTDENGNTTEVLVAEHKDIEDEDQTVEIPKTPKTGDNYTIFLFSLLFILSASLALVVRKMHCRKQ